LKREWILQVTYGEVRIQRYLVAGNIFRWGPFAREESNQKANELITREFIEGEKRFSQLGLLWEFSQPAWAHNQVPEPIRKRFICCCIAGNSMHAKYVRAMCQNYHPEVPANLRFSH
jgi:hypothetical protein